MPHQDDPGQWRPWVDEACQAVGVDPRLVDLDAVLALTGTVAHRLARPMAPVAAHILGLAMASGDAARPGRLIEALVSTLPPEDDAASAGS